ncbi:DUF2914 domain-containing protein [Chondromyces crocatus]|uniref:DUF2914 domain-containing protein n=1 Tax=Chondromyces crocatus TaxID=52 RepID=A0A0K1EJP9_CHOCO|nr:DUF2914 domain-containing protein [Chondromyces crocatus]AKT40917.1 uncharacterized protein CMC5_050740 [Chondromyces crocatus]
MEPLRNTRGALARALFVVACGGAALGCNALEKASEDIAREEPAALNRGADNRPGEGPTQAPAKPMPDPKARPDTHDDPAAPVIDDLAASEGEAAEASESGKRRAVARTPQRRRRSASAERAAAENAAEPGDGSAEHADVAAVPYKLARLQVARTVAGREPVGVARSFTLSDAEKLHVFVELTNDARAAGEIFVTFTPPSGSGSPKIKLDVGAERRWRTWASTRRVRTPGTWGVVITDATGAVLGRTSFTVTR